MKRALALVVCGLACSCEGEATRSKPAVSTPSASAEPKSPYGDRRPLRSPRPRKSAAADAGPDPLALHAPDGAVLEQTEERPSAQSPLLQERAALLFRAIVADDPSLARPVFFPLVAYERVKASPNPRRDWQRRLMAHFERDIHAYHRRLGETPGKARFIDLYVPEDGVRWMNPGTEHNRIGYFRVLRSRLRYADAEGRQQSFEVTSLISWRGQWYVVHLDGFE